MAKSAAQLMYVPVLVNPNCADVCKLPNMEIFIIRVALRWMDAWMDVTGCPSLRLRGRLELAEGAGCRPAEQVVELRLPGNTSTQSELLFPACTRVLRCGGCCSHPLLSCQPTQSSTVELVVLVLDPAMMQDRREVVQVEEHTDCSCDCRVQARHCNPRQV